MTRTDELITGELRIGGQDRGFTLRLPKQAPDDRPMPLALVLHGNMQDYVPDKAGSFIRRRTTFDTQADGWGLAVAYPNGVGGSWADGRGVTAADDAGVDDVAFLRAVIDWSAERYGTAPDRTLVAGMSNGAFMAHRMGLEASDRVAVLAAVAGQLPAALSDHQPTHAVSAFLIHGTADQRVPIGGGYSRRRDPNGELRGRTLSLAESAQRWRTIDRCPDGPGETVTTESTRRVTVGGGVGGSRVAAWTVIGGGHAWPGAPRRTGVVRAQHPGVRRGRGDLPLRRSAARRRRHPPALTGDHERGETMAVLGTLLKNRRAGQDGLAWNSPNLAGADTLTLTSPDFAPEATIPTVHAAKRLGGRDLSPALTWTPVPEGTRQLLLVVEDPDAPTAEPFVHCVALLDPAVTDLARGALDANSPADGVRVLRSGMGRGYRGPGPIKGHGPHRYVFQVFALAEPVTAAASGAALDAAKPRDVLGATGTVLARGRLDGFYERR